MSYHLEILDWSSASTLFLVLSVTSLTLPPFLMRRLFSLPVLSPVILSCSMQCSLFLYSPKCYCQYFTFSQTDLFRIFLIWFGPLMASSSIMLVLYKMFSCLQFSTPPNLPNQTSCHFVIPFLLLTGRRCPLSQVNQVTLTFFSPVCPVATGKRSSLLVSVQIVSQLSNHQSGKASCRQQ